MKRKIIFTNYKGYTTDLRKTLAIRFGLTVKQDQIRKFMNGDVCVEAEMTDAQYERIKVWRDEMSGVSIE